MARSVGLPLQEQPALLETEIAGGENLEFKMREGGVAGVSLAALRNEIPVLKSASVDSEMRAIGAEVHFEDAENQFSCIFFKKIAKKYIQLLVFCTKCFFFVLVFRS